MGRSDDLCRNGLRLFGQVEAWAFQAHERIPAQNNGFSHGARAISHLVSCRDQIHVPRPAGIAGLVGA
jgi:hypothetical protein